jgi:hypothetical protein
MKHPNCFFVMLFKPIIQDKNHEEHFLLRYVVKTTHHQNLTYDLI